MNSVDSIVAEYLAKGPAEGFERSKLLCLGSRKDRFHLCHRLGIEVASRGEKQKAGFFMQRAFDLWNGEPGFIDHYLHVLHEERETERLRLAARQAGMFALKRGHLFKALGYFNTSQYAAPSTGGGDSYHYDQEILHAIDALPQSGPPRIADVSKPRLRIRIAYLTFGAEQCNSVLVRLLADFIRHHDSDRFEIGYFSCDALSDQRKETERTFSSLGAKLIAPDSFDGAVCLRETEASLKSFAPDLLVGVAVLADYRNYYLFSRFPEVKRVVLCYGPPAQYIPPSADFVIGGTWHPVLDSPVDGAVVEIETTLPVRPTLSSATPADLGHLPDEAIVILAAGRSEKFADIRYWSALIAVLEDYTDVYFVAVGLTQRPEFWDRLIAGAPVRDRIITVGWVENYRDYVLRADIVVDTFPSGGGLTVLDAMAFGIPVISFQDDYLQPFDQVNWNLGEELLPSGKLIVPRDDLEKLTLLVSMLVKSPDQRRHYGEICQEHVRRARGNPARMVHRIEAHYKDVLSRPPRYRERHQAAPCLACSMGFRAVFASRVQVGLLKVRRLISRFR